MLQKNYFFTFVQFFPKLEGLLVGWTTVVDFVEIQSGIGSSPLLDGTGQSLHQEWGIARRRVKLSAQSQSKNWKKLSIIIILSILVSKIFLEFWTMVIVVWNKVLYCFDLVVIRFHQKLSKLNMNATLFFKIFSILKFIDLENRSCQTWNYIWTNLVWTSIPDLPWFL